MQVLLFRNKKEKKKRKYNQRQHSTASALFAPESVRRLREYGREWKQIAFTIAGAMKGNSIRWHSTNYMRVTRVYYLVHTQIIKSNNKLCRCRCTCISVFAIFVAHTIFRFLFSWLSSRIFVHPIRRSRSPPRSISLLWRLSPTFRSLPTRLVIYSCLNLLKTYFLGGFRSAASSTFTSHIAVLWQIAALSTQKQLQGRSVCTRFYLYT